MAYMSQVHILCEKASNLKRKDRSNRLINIWLIIYWIEETRTLMMRSGQIGGRDCNFFLHIIEYMEQGICYRQISDMNLSGSVNKIIVCNNS